MRLMSERPVGQSAARVLLLVAFALLAGCQSLQAPIEGPELGSQLDASIQVLASPQSTPRERGRAAREYRRLVAAHLPQLLGAAAEPGLVPAGQRLEGIQDPETFAEITPAQAPRKTTPGLHRRGLGLPAIGTMPPGDPNAPRAGYRVPLTLVALPQNPPTRCCDAALVDPRRVDTVRTARGELPVAMDLEAPLDATRATGPRLGAGLLNLLRPGGFAGRPRVVFLQPFDPDKRPLVLVHGLMSTPRMWEPLVKDLLADPLVRAKFQIWFFYYPTGQPVPLSALQLREALDDAVARYRPRHPMILVGHSMGGILSRAQVSGIGEQDVEPVIPTIGSFPQEAQIRRALIFEPRTDVSRVVFMFTPHRGSRLASGGLGAWGIRLIRLPDTLINELSAVGDQLAGTSYGRLPTSIHGLSPNSQFLRALDAIQPSVPTHSIIGDRGRGDGPASSDGVVPYSSSHLEAAKSELIVPAGHGGFAHPLAVAELIRILHESLKEEHQNKGVLVATDEVSRQPSSSRRSAK